MKAVGIVGSYRKGGVIDSAVTEALAGAENVGYRPEKIFLAERNIELCHNCRVCMQEPGREPGRCVIDDDMAELIRTCKSADLLIIGSPVNMGSITAGTKAFMERTAPMAFWPWGANIPKVRDSKRSPRPRAVLITSSVMPAFIGKLAFSAPASLRSLAKNFDARISKELYFGLVGRNKGVGLSPKQLEQARRAGEMAAWCRGLELTWPIDGARAMLFAG